MSATDTKLVPAVCPHCGGKIQVNPDSEAAVCEYCETPFIVEKAVNEYQVLNQEIHNHNESTTVINKRGVVGSVLDYMENKQIRREEQTKKEIEYQRQEMERLQREEREEKEYKRKIVPWVLGWIFCFPIPLMIIIGRNSEMTDKMKRTIIIAGWAAYILMLIIGNIGNHRTQSNVPHYDPEVARSYSDMASNYAEEAKERASSIQEEMSDMLKDYGY